MWSKLNQRLTKLFKTEKKQTADAVIQQAIIEIEQAIFNTHKAYHSAMQNEQRIAQQLANWQQQSANYYQQATAATQSGDDTTARSQLISKKNADQQVQKYAELHQKALFASKEMERQLGTLQFRQEEMHSKKVLLKAQLEGAQQQKSLNELLTDLGEEGVLDDMESQLQQLEIENQLSEGLSEIDLVLNELDGQEKGDLDELKTEIETKAREVQKAQEAKQFKKVGLLLSQTDNRLKERAAENLHSIKVRQIDLLNNLMNQPEDSSKDFITDFFATSSSLPEGQSEEENEVEEKLLDQFSKEVKPDSPNWQQKILQQFKETEHQKDDQQKQIDDFFGE